MDPLPAQTPTPATLPHTEVHTLHSEQVGGDFQLQVALPVPGTRGALPDEYPVLYLLDGDLWFGTATENTRLLYQFMGELPPLLVVGIGYGTADWGLRGELRTRDYTPTPVPEYGEMIASMGREPTLPPGKRMGGAEAFLDFLEHDVRPFVEGRWPVEEGRSVLFGSSTGGLLATWALLTRPHLMDGWILTSPSVWWDDGVALERERASAEEGQELRGRVFLAAGSLEEGIGTPGLDRYRLVSNTRLLAERLQSREDPELEVGLEIVEGETHTSVVPTALIRGLRAVLARRPPPRRPSGPPAPS